MRPSTPQINKQHIVFIAIFSSAGIWYCRTAVAVRELLRLGLTVPVKDGDGLKSSDDGVFDHAPEGNAPDVEKKMRDVIINAAKTTFRTARAACAGQRRHSASH